jgi:hypothetical protein
MSEDFKEALILLDLIDAEFQSDPMSQQCFDIRIVQRVRALVEKYRKRPDDPEALGRGVETR